MRAIDVINTALFAAKVSSEFKPASPEMLSRSFVRLVEWLNQLIGEGVTLGIPENQPPLTQPGDEIGNDPIYDLALGDAFARIAASQFGRPLPRTAALNANRAFDKLYGDFMKAAVPEWPETLPVGQGNQRGVKGRVYFPVPRDVYFIPDDEETVTP